MALSLLLCIAVAMQACTLTMATSVHRADDWMGSTSYNLMDVLADSPEHTLLVRMLQRTRLIPTLNRIMQFDDGRGLTIFAPTDEAIQRKREAEQAKRSALSEGLHLQTQSPTYQDEDGMEVLSPAWAYPRSAKTMWEWAVDLAVHDEDDAGHSPMHTGNDRGGLHLPVTLLPRGDQAWIKVDNIESALRAQLLYHMLNYTLPANVSDGIMVSLDAAMTEDVKEAKMFETLHRPSRSSVHTRPGTIPHPPSRPGLEDDGWLLGGEGQRVRLATRSEKAEKSSLWIGTDGTGEKGGAKVMSTNRNSSAGVVYSIDAVLELPPDFGEQSASLVKVCSCAWSDERSLAQARDSPVLAPCP